MIRGPIRDTCIVKDDEGGQLTCKVKAESGPGLCETCTRNYRPRRRGQVACIIYGRWAAYGEDPVIKCPGHIPEEVA